MSDLIEKFKELSQPIENKYFSTTLPQESLTATDMLERLETVQNILPNLEKDLRDIGNNLLEKYSGSEEDIEVIKEEAMNIVRRVTKSHVNGPHSVER